MKQLHEITDKFKLTKVRVPMTGDLSTDFQKAMFTMGFRWSHEQSGTTRNLMLEAFGQPLHALYVDKNCRILQTTNAHHFSVLTDYREITPLQLFEAVKEYKALDKQIRKAKKAEKKLTKEEKLTKEGWIIWGGSDGVCPVAAGTKVSVIFAGKKFDTSRPEFLEWRWTSNGGGGDITAYRLSKPEPAKQEPAKTISLQDMITNIVADAGGKEVDADGFIVHNPDTCTLPDFEAPDGLKAGEYEVKLRNGTVVNGVRTFGNDCDSPYQVVAYRRKPETLGSSADILDAAGTILGVTRVTEVAEPAPDTNPKKQFGLASIPLNMWSNLASSYGALGLYNGALKYGAANFANTKVEASIYIAAIKRHLAAWEAGEEFDPADGVPNLGGVLANVAIILEARAAGTLIDDRAAMSGYLKERDALKAIVGQLQVVHAGKTPKHYTLGA